MSLTSLALVIGVQAFRPSRMDGYRGMRDNPH